jgi:hypothetical protein
MHIHRIDKLYWKLLLGITAMHMIEDSIMVTFFKFAPLPLWVLYLIVLAFSGLMANYAYFIAKGYSPKTLWRCLWNRR